MKRDKYDDAVEYLAENPDRIQAAWSDPINQRGGCLFQFAGDILMDDCGCLTMIRNAGLNGSVHDWCVYKDRERDESLTRLVRLDHRLPHSSDDITVEHLSVFAEWQRRLDVLIRGVDPESLNNGDTVVSDEPNVEEPVTTPAV